MVGTQGPPGKQVRGNWEGLGRGCMPAEPEETSRLESQSRRSGGHGADEKHLDPTDLK